MLWYQLARPEIGVGCDSSQSTLTVKQALFYLNVHNNTLIATAAQLTVARGLLGIIDNNTSANSPSNDCAAYNNIFLTTTTAISLVDCEHTTSAVGLDVNYSIMHSGDGDNVQNIVVASTYTTFAAAGGWQATAGQDANGINADPIFANVIDYELSSTSPAATAGNKWWADENPVGYNNEPFSDIDTDIGASQSQHGSFHPVNL